MRALLSVVLVVLLAPGCVEEVEEKIEHLVPRTGGKVISVNSLAAFDGHINSGKPVVVDFYGPNCPPCQRMHPIHAVLAKKYPGVTFLKVNVRSASALASRYGVMSIPRFIFFKDGKRVHSHGGKMSAVAYEGKIKQYLK